MSSPADRVDATDACACGHVLDEHDKHLACTVEGCGCFYFERAETDDDAEDDPDAE